METVEDEALLGSECLRLNRENLEYNAHQIAKILEAPSAWFEAQRDLSESIDQIATFSRYLAVRHPDINASFISDAVRIFCKILPTNVAAVSFIVSLCQNLHFSLGEEGGLATVLEAGVRRRFSRSVTSGHEVQEVVVPALANGTLRLNILFTLFPDKSVVDVVEKKVESLGLQPLFIFFQPEEVEDRTPEEILIDLQSADHFSSVTGYD